MPLRRAGLWVILLDIESGPQRQPVHGRPGAFDVSASGETVVGFGTTAQGPEAFLWTATRGMRRILDLLLEMGVHEARGWTLSEATAISASGHVVIGNGTNPSGQREGWMAVLR